jgi:hypothetical protein
MPPNAPMPPIPPVPPEAPRTREVTEDFVIEAPIPSDGIDADDIVVESPNSLRNIQVDSLDNMLRIRITKSVGERNELRREMQRLSNDLRRKTREFRKLRIDIDKDTTGLAEALDQANKAFDSAQESVSRLDSNIVFLRSRGRASVMGMNANPAGLADRNNGIRMMIDSAIANNMRWLDGGSGADFMRHFNVQVSDSIGGCNKQIVIVNSFGDEDSVAGVRPNDPFGAFASDEANVMMLISGDSAGDNHTMSFINKMHGKGQQSIMVRQTTGCNEGHRTQTIVLRSFGSDSTQAFASADVKADPAPFVVFNNRIVIGQDSLQIVDGKDRQMVICMDREKATANGRARLVVITVSRAKKAETDAAPTEPTDLMKSNATSATNGYALEANTPNPFTESTTISFTLPKPEHATLTVFDANGSTVKVLKDEELPAGTHTARLDASGLPSGIYLYRLVAGGFSETKTMTIAK